jgi:hypothetical protein
MNPAPTPPEPQEPSPAPHRLFLFEQGWGVGLKVGSERVFCYMMAPGQDYYHRLLDGELYLFRGDERLCLACASRRGLLSFEPRGLREPMEPVDLIDDLQGLSDPLDGGEFDLVPGTDDDDDEDY